MDAFRGRARCRSALQLVPASPRLARQRWGRGCVRTPSARGASHFSSAVRAGLKSEIHEHRRCVPCPGLRKMAPKKHSRARIHWQKRYACIMRAERRNMFRYRFSSLARLRLVYRSLCRTFRSWYYTSILPYRHRPNTASVCACAGAAQRACSTRQRPAWRHSADVG